MAMEQERHRPGLLKQTNKTHKHGKHKSKGSLETVRKGKVNIKTISKKVKKNTREDRRNQASQIRKNKRDEVLSERRKLLEAPFMVAVVPLSNSIVLGEVIQMIETADSEAIVTHSSEGHLHLSLPRFKQRFSFVLVDTSNIFDVLDALKAADTVLFVMSPSEGIDSTGRVLLSAIIAQGLPTSAMAIFNLNNVPIKKRNDCKQDIEKDVQKFIPEEKVMGLSNAMDVLNIMRKIGNQKQRKIVFRDRRPHLLAEKLDFSYKENAEGAASTTGVLKVTGYLRGQNLSVNSLVHIPGWGDFQMSQIDISDDPHPLNPHKQEGMAEDSVRVLEKADPSKQVSLQSEITPDPMDAEQTWPSKAELEEATQEQERQKEKARVKRIPKGFSDYQAAWIPDSDAEEEFMSSEDEHEDGSEEGEEEEEEDAMSVPESHAGADVEKEDTMSTYSEAPVDKDKYDKAMDLEEEQEALRKLQEAQLDAQFPDELDTPLDQQARVRFQKYRGLESFRTSAWDPKENLPHDYGRIFQFQNFARTRKRVLKQCGDDSEGAQPGWYITVHIDGVPEALLLGACQGGSPLLLYGLLPHEAKMSVLNMLLKRPPAQHLASPEPLASKQELWIQAGFRRFRASPIFSQHTNGNKHKYERFFQPDSTVMATCFAPILFPPAPVLAFKKMKDDSMELVAMGSLHSVNPDRLVVKRVILSGHPLKIHKRSAVVRFMFFNREDIEWFKPVELRTKYGRRGHIKEPLGTHGHMKCVFDGQLKSQDTVLMHLFKRVFPKWNYQLV